MILLKIMPCSDYKQDKLQFKVHLPEESNENFLMLKIRQITYKIQFEDLYSKVIFISNRMGTLT